MPARGGCRPRCCTTRSIARPAPRRRSPALPPGPARPRCPMWASNLPDGFLGNLGRPARESACECERSSNLQLGPVMALVSGPTVGDAISDPDNAVAKLVAEVADNGELVNQLFLRFLNRPGKPDEVERRDADVRTVGCRSRQAGRRARSVREGAGARRLPTREIERQGRVAGLQAELEAHREIVKLRRPREERERQERIAKAQAALAEYDKQLAAKLPEWEAAQKSADAVAAARCRSRSGASYRARFTRQADGSIFVEGDKAKGSYRIAAPIAARSRHRHSAGSAGRRSACRAAAPAAAAAATSSSPNSPPAGCRRPARRSSSRAGIFPAPTTIGRPRKAPKSSPIPACGICSARGKPAGIKTSLKEPAGSYLLEVVTGIRSAVTFTVQWTTANAADVRRRPLGAAFAAGRRRRPRRDADRDPGRRGADRPANRRRRRPGRAADRRGPAVRGRRRRLRRHQAAKGPGHVQPGRLRGRDGDRRQHARPRPTTAGRSRRKWAAITRRCSNWRRRSKARKDRVLEVIDSSEFRRRPAFAWPVPHFGDRRGAAAQFRLAGGRSPRSSPSRPTSGPMPSEMRCWRTSARTTSSTRSCRPSWPASSSRCPKTRD